MRFTFTPPELSKRIGSPKISVKTSWLPPWGQSSVLCSRWHCWRLAQLYFCQGISFQNCSAPLSSLAPFPLHRRDSLLPSWEHWHALQALLSKLRYREHITSASFST